MKYIIDKNIKSPAYIQLYTQVRNDIINNIYPYGTKLPSKRLISDETGISTITVEHAYSLLYEEGYIEPRERSGYFVTFLSSDAYASFPTKEICSTVSNEKVRSSSVNAFSFSTIAKLMRKVMNEKAELIMKKSPNLGIMELRTAISDYLQRSRGIKAQPEQIIIGSGAEQIYSFIIKVLGNDKIYAIESPSYEKIEKVYTSAGVEIEKLDLCDDGINSLQLSKSNADVLHVTPYRSFPSGVTASASKRHEYIRWARKNNRYIIEDDFESEFSVSTKPVETIFSLSKNKNVIYINTFSKTVSPSLRAGYLVLPKKLVEVFQREMGFCSCTVPTFEQYLLTELIESGTFERNINRVRRLKRKEMES